MSEKGERIAKVMARAGVCSRRDAERWIEAGRVKVNGKKIDSPALNVVSKDKIMVDGKLLAEKAEPCLYLYHKPTGQVTTHKDPQDRPTVFSELPSELGRLISVGRLDLNTEGLLLLTNDGALADVLSHPSTALLRTYRVRVFGRVSQEQLDRLKKGLVVKDEHGKTMRYGRIDATLDAGDDKKNCWITMKIREGKNREIRNICRALGLQVSRLIRTEYGPFALGNLPVGDIKQIKERQFKRFLGERES